MGYTLSTSFTRPANTTQYAVGDLIANSETAASVIPLIFDNKGDMGRIYIRRIRFFKSGTSLTSASFRIHLFTKTPTTITNGDNGAFSVSNISDYLGAFDVTLSRAFTDGAFGVALPMSGNEVNALNNSYYLYGLVEARGTYTPASGEVFTATIEFYKE